MSTVNQNNDYTHQEKKYKYLICISTSFPKQ